MEPRLADDIRFMEEALALAQRAAGRASPNPMVGAVVVAGGQIVGRGYHRKAGEPHAEVLALDEAGERARDATVYVNLEPCAHHGRTGPCADALVTAGVRRVVAAMPDPDIRVSGQGFGRLRKAGITVDVGVLEPQARRLNEFYIKHRVVSIPFGTLKWAMSLDGKISSDRAKETQITGSEAQRYVHELRNVHDAVLVGIGTVLADDPRLTCRLPGGRNPLRIVVDSRLRTPPGANVLSPEAHTLIVTTSQATTERIKALDRAHVEVLVQETDRDRVLLRPLFEELARRGILSVLIEGGGRVNAAALTDGLVDKVIAFVAPIVIGGPDAPTPVDGPSLLSIAGPLRIRDVTVRRVGDDIALEGYVD